MLGKRKRLFSGVTMLWKKSSREEKKLLVSSTVD